MDIIIMSTMKCFQKNVHIIRKKVLHHNRNDFCEGIDINKTSSSKQYIICDYWYFIGKEFKFQTFLCN